MHGERLTGKVNICSIADVRDADGGDFDNEESENP
jgi:hypothetical protein